MITPTMISSEAWVLHKGPPIPTPGELVRERVSFPNITAEEVLVEPIYGSWEGNMTHALQRDPIDICRYRSEDKVVLGNAGVVRVLKLGAAVTSVKEGDLCMLLGVARWDQFGYPERIWAYDAPGTMGLFAKQIKLPEKLLFRITNSRFSPKQWATFSVRYGTAWDNWKIAYGAFRLQMSVEDCPAPYVWGWGGGVALAELTLAKQFGCHAAMISSHDTRLELIKKLGVTPVDRRQFADLHFDEERFESDFAYRRQYIKAEQRFLQIVAEETNGAGVSIFVDHLGGPVFRPTLKALSRQGVITTSGWKRGMKLSTMRGAECIARHIHVHTHGCRQSLDAMHYGEETGWMPPIGADHEVYSWDNIPLLAEDFRDGRLETYFPLYQVNPL